MYVGMANVRRSLILRDLCMPKSFLCGGSLKVVTMVFIYTYTMYVSVGDVSSRSRSML